MRRPLAFLTYCVILSSLAFSTGCYHMYSQPYGYSGVPAGTTYPGAAPYGAPIQTLTPGQPYVPGGTYQAVPGTGTPTYQGGGLQPIPDNGTPPTYNNNNSTIPNNPGTNPTTPDPYFQGNAFPPAGLNSIQPTAYAAPAPLNPPTSPIRELRPADTDYVPSTNTLSAIPTESGASGNNLNTSTPATSLMPLSNAETFAPPVMSAPPPRGMPAAAPLQAAPQPVSSPYGVTPASAQSLWDMETRKVVSASAEVSPFGQDPKFQWLRGVVSRDPQDGAWSIVYDDAPSSADRWSGHLVLAENPQFDRLRDGDIVEVQGQLDPVVQERSGKPVYVVSSFRKLYDATP